MWVSRTRVKSWAKAVITVFAFFLQSKEGETCNVTMQGLDSEKCYFFRARVKTLESSYGSDTYPSDWSKVTHQQRGQLRGEACYTAVHRPAACLLGRVEWGHLKTRMTSLPTSEFSLKVRALLISLSRLPTSLGNFIFICINSNNNNTYYLWMLHWSGHRL